MRLEEKIKVIIADDNHTFVDALCTWLLEEEDQYEILDTCYNGKELLENSKLGYADVIITDIEMPVMNGIEAAMKINIIYSKLPLIALTMHKDKVYLNEIIGAGFKAFIYKPEIADCITDVISEVLKDNFIFPDDLKLI